MFIVLIYYAVRTKRQVMQKAVDKRMTMKYPDCDRQPVDISVDWLNTLIMLYLEDECIDGWSVWPAAVAQKSGIRIQI